MRTKLVILAVAMFAAIPLGNLPAQTNGADTEKPAAVDYNTVYKSGVSLYNSGKWLAADGKFRQVLGKYPKHVQSMRYRAMIRNKLRQEAAVPAMKKALRELVVPEAKFDQAQLSEVLEFATRKAKELSGGKITPGLVITGGNAVRQRPVTLNVSGMPLDSFIELVAQMADTKIEYHTHAIKVIALPTAAEQQAELQKKLEKAEAEERKRAGNSAADDPFGSRRR